MNIKNNQVEDLKTYRVVRTINWRENFSEEVQAKSEEEASTKAKILFLKELEEWVMTPQQMYDMTTEEVVEVDTSLKVYDVEVDLPDLHLAVVARSEDEAIEIAQNEGNQWIDKSEYYCQNGAKLVCDARTDSYGSGISTVGVLDSKPFSFNQESFS